MCYSNMSQYRIKIEFFKYLLSVVDTPCTCCPAHGTINHKLFLGKEIPGSIPGGNKNYKVFNFSSNYICGHIAIAHG